MKERRDIGFSTKATIAFSPEAEIEHLAKNAKIGKEIDWKPAIILSATYLEKFGTERLKRYFEEKKQNE